MTTKRSLFRAPATRWSSIAKLHRVSSPTLRVHIGIEGGSDAILHFGRKHTRSLRIALGFGTHDYEAILVPSASDTLVFDSEVAQGQLADTARSHRNRGWLRCNSPFRTKAHSIVAHSARVWNA